MQARRLYPSLAHPTSCISACPPVVHPLISCNHRVSKIVWVVFPTLGPFSGRCVGCNHIFDEFEVEIDTYPRECRFGFTTAMARAASLWFWTAIATLLARLEASRRLRRCPFSLRAAPEPSWRVAQVIRGQLHRWEEHQLDEHTSCIIKLYPKRKVLGDLEAKKFLDLTSFWEFFAGPYPSWEEVLDSRDVSFGLPAERAPYSENDTKSWYDRRSGLPYSDAEVSRSDSETKGREAPLWIGLPENGTDGRVVIGTDLRTQVQDTRKFPYQTIGYVEMSWPSAARSRCTAFLISPFVALTNAHCVYSENQGGWVDEAKFAPAQYVTSDNFLSRPYGSGTSCNAATNIGYIHSPNSGQDYAALFFPTPFHGFQTFMPLVFSFTPKLGSELRSAGYPGLPQETFSVDMWESAGEVIDASDRIIRHTVDTSSGQSGSPLFRPVGYLMNDAVIGLHSFGRSGANGGPRFVFENEPLIVTWMKEGPAACTFN